MCMPMVFWAAQTMAAYSLLGVRVPTFMSYISPTSAATAVQLAYRSYAKRVVQQHCVAISGANMMAIPQQTPTHVTLLRTEMEDALGPAIHNLSGLAALAQKSEQDITGLMETSARTTQDILELRQEIDGCGTLSGLAALVQKTEQAIIGLLESSAKAVNANAKAVNANTKTVDATTKAIAALVASSLARPLQTFDNC